jgi:TRAP transporter 4TM/12TM fusion protein
MDKEIEEKLGKLKDVEVSSKRIFTGGLAYAIGGIGLLMSFFHIYILFFRATDPWIFRSLHVVFGGILLFAIVPGWKGAPRAYLHFVDYLFIAALIAPVVYIFSDLEGIIFRMGVDPNSLDIFFSVVFILVIFEMTRRTTGLSLVITVLCFVFYGYFGKYLPGVLEHHGYSWGRILTYVFSLDGILGIPIFSSATYIFLFIIFGAFLEGSGATLFFVDFARSLAGSRRGGPGKISIVSSAMIGTVSGSSVANVVIDGVFNIPLMKASGFKATVAGAIEAMNSTAGQIVPPVMGTAAFIMAEILGVPYSKVCVAAIVPSILYYVAAYWMIDFYSAKKGLVGVPKSELPRFSGLIVKKGYLLLPLVLLIYLLMALQLSPFRAVMWSTLLLIGLSLFKKETRLGLIKILKILSFGPQGMIEIVSTCAAAGIIIGVISLTGLGMRFAMIVINYSHGSLLLALFLTMLITLILGMGLPTTAAYAISASILAPALIKLNVPPMAAHMFVFYFACLSALTPPVCVAAYAAGAIAKAPVWNVGWASVKFAIAGFIIPYMFVYGPPLLLMGGNAPEMILAFITAVLGTLLLAGGVQGWFFKTGNLGYIQRGFLLVGSLLLLKPGWITDIAGVLILLVVLFLHRKKRSDSVS